MVKQTILKKKTQENNCDNKNLQNSTTDLNVGAFSKVRDPQNSGPPFTPTKAFKLPRPGM